MRKIIIFLVVVTLVASLAVTASAATPALKVPTLPQVPTIKPVQIELPANFWADWFASHPLNIWG